MVSPARRSRILYLFVHDDGYPRNQRIREFLHVEFNADIVVVPKPTPGRRLARLGRALRSVLAAHGRFDAVVLSEFSIQYFPIAWMASRFKRALLVVDFFVGLYETEVDDANQTMPNSMRAHLLSIADRISLRGADVVITDTEPRAQRFRRLARNTPVFHLPVGAPPWARIEIDEDRVPDLSSEAIRVLYYGSYLPLHGTPVLVDFLRAPLPFDLRLTLVGGGPQRSMVEAALQAAGISDRATLLDYMPPQELRELIRTHDVVLGVFGVSAKASEVVANKVWQSLSLNRAVVTRGSPALAELQDIAGEILVQITVPLSREPFLEAIVAAARVSGSRAGIAAALENHVVQAFRKTFSDPSFGALRPSQDSSATG